MTAVITGNNPGAALVTALLVALAAMAALLRIQAAAWHRASNAQLFDN